jgi:hypothetical protein
MRKLYALILVLAIAVSGYSQYFYLKFATGTNPGGLNTEDAEYPAGGGLPAGWTTILPANPSPTWSAMQPLPFPFTFNGITHSDYYVSNSGVVTFSPAPGAAPGFTPTALPNASIPDNSVCIWGIQGITAGSDNVVSKTFGTAPNRQHWVFFTSYTLGTGTNWSYWGIVMEETSNKVYIVDMRSFQTSGPLTLGLQYDAGNALNVAGSPAITPEAGNDPTAVDNVYYEFTPGSQPGENIFVNAVNLTEFLILNQAPYTISGDLTNLGANALTSYTLNYSINGGSAVSANITGQNVASGAKGTFSHPTGWTPAGVGQYTVKVWTSRPNGGSDADNTNDTVEVLVKVLDNFIPRKPLYEIFTSSTCPPCTPGNQNFHSIVANYPDEYVAIKYQQDFPGTGDPYCTTEAVSRRSYYAVNSIPRMEIDGGWDGNANVFTSQLHEQYRAIPAFYDIAVEYEIVKDSQKIKYCIDIDPLEDLSNVTMHVAILERITYSNVKTNGETEFENVMKKMVPSDLGRTINLSKNNEYTLCEEYIFNGDYRLPLNGQTANRTNHATEHSIEDFENLYVIVWLQNAATKEVYQSAEGTLKVTTGIAPQPEVALQVVPNPASEQAQVIFSLDESQEVAVELFNSVGQRVDVLANGRYTAGQHVVNARVAGLAAGVYIVKITANGVATTRQLTVVK